MSIQSYRIVIHGKEGDREVRVASPTGVEAIDAASPLLRPGETLGPVAEVDGDGLQQTDAPAPKSQAGELADVKPGMASSSGGRE